MRAARPPAIGRQAVTEEDEVNTAILGSRVAGVWQFTHPCSIYGAARRGETLDSTALGHRYLIGMRSARCLVVRCETRLVN
jgi:hypothetical protein